jgi:two-component system chemotaxis response regulator CheB
MAYDLVVMGASWGGLVALERVLSGLPEDFGAAVAIAQHRSPDRHSEGLAPLLGTHTRLPVIDADDKQPIEPGTVYLAPPDYHLYVEEDGFALSMDEAVLYSRPSIDVLFESAADAYGDRLAAVLLSGANDDGAAGFARIHDAGGIVAIQDPSTAPSTEMPDAALRLGLADRVLSPAALGRFLVELGSHA